LKKKKKKKRRAEGAFAGKKASMKQCQPYCGKPKRTQKRRKTKWDSLNNCD